MQGEKEREGGRREYVTEDRAKRDGGERDGTRSLASSRGICHPRGKEMPKEEAGGSSSWNRKPVLHLSNLARVYIYLSLFCVCVYLSARLTLRIVSRITCCVACSIPRHTLSRSRALPLIFSRKMLNA